MPSCYCVPRTIDPTGDTDVTSALQSWINSIPDGTEGNPNVLLFDPSATYLTQTELLLSNRKNLVLDGDGCHFVRTFFPFTHTSITIALASATAVGTTATFTAVSTLQPIDTFANIKITGCTPSQYNGTWAVIEVVNDTTVKAVLASDPGGPATVVGDIQRMTMTNHHIRVTDDGTQANPSENIILRNFTIDGPNNEIGGDGHSPNLADYEFQFGLFIQGLVGGGIENVTVNRVGGDGICTQARNPDAGVFLPCQNIHIKDSKSFWTGRQGFTLYGLDGSNLVSKCTIQDAARSAIDHEPPGSETGHAYVKVTVEDLTILDHYGGDTIVAAQGGGGLNWGPIVYRRVTATSGGKADQFFKGINNNANKRGPVTIEDVNFVGVGAAGGGGTWSIFHFGGTGWKDVLIRNNTCELTQVAQDVGGLKLENCNNVTAYGNTFTNVYNYGGSPSWYGDGGGNTNISVS